MENTEIGPLDSCYQTITRTTHLFNFTESSSIDLGNTSRFS